mgnify:CR=1 FL=1
MARRFRYEAEDISRDLDLVVYRLEQTPAAPDAAALTKERKQLRRELERLRQRLDDLVRDLD